MISTPPGLRRDLTVKQQETTSGASFVVKDPVSGDFFRLREAEYYIAQQLDGRTTLDAVRQRAEARFGASVPIETLHAFVKTLVKTNLLETEEAARRRKKGSSRKKRRISGNLLYFRIKVCDPDRLLERLVPRLRFFFTPAFMSLSAALILTAAGTVFMNRTELADDLARLGSFAAISVLLAVLCIVVSAHEFAHGLTCKWFGGDVHEMGFMLMYFQPAFYCDVSDAWLFPEKRKRLWVGFAGPYFELTIWALAAMIWRWTDAESWLHDLALIVAGGVGIKTLFNFNPLLKFDGYYLLSDYIEVPNLRRRSFAYIGTWCKRLLGLADPTGTEIPLRDRRMYLSYGLMAVLFSVSALGYAFVKLGDLFIQNGQPLVLFLASSLVGLKVRRRFNRLFRKSSALSASDDDEDDDEHERSESVEKRESTKKEAAEEPGKPKEIGRKSTADERDWKKWGAWTAAAAVLLAVLFLGHMELKIAGPVNILPEENSDVRAPLEEIIDSIEVDEGDVVKAGQRIARLSDKALLAEMGKTEAETSEARSNLRKLQAGPTEAEIQVARTAVSKADDTLKYAQSRLGKMRSLFQKNLLSPKELEDAEEQATAAANDLAEAKSRLNLLRHGSRPEEIAAVKAQIDRLETQKRYLDVQLGWLDVLSPVSGVVATPSRELKEMKHQLVKKGDLIAKVFDMDRVTAQIFVSERDLDGLQVGQRVELRARAYPDRSFYGAVTSIATSAQGGASPSAEPGRSPLSSATSTTKTVIVTTLIDNRSRLLKPEMTGQAKVFCGRRRIVDLIARRMALTFNVAIWSWW